MNLFVVLKVDDTGDAWEFIGVYDTQDAAEAAATTARHMVGPCVLNLTAPDQTEEWPGAYYPKAVGS